MQRRSHLAKTVTPLAASLLLFPTLTPAAEKVNQDPVPGGGIETFRFTSDKNHVLYSGEFNSQGQFELLSSPTRGKGPHVTLNPTPTSGGNLARRQFQSVSSNRALFLGDFTVDGRVDMYSALVDKAGASIRLNSHPVHKMPSEGPSPQPLVDDKSVRVLSDQQTVLYKGTSPGPVPGPVSGPSPKPGNLYSTRVDKVAPDAQITTGGAPDRYRVTPDQKRIVYRAASAGDLLSAPVDGSSAPVKLNTRTARTDLFIGAEADYRISADGQHVVIGVDEDVGQQLGTDVLYSAPIDGSKNAEVIADPEPEDGKLGSFDDPGFFIGPADKYVFYEGDLGPNGEFERHAAPLDNSHAPVTLQSSSVSATFTPDRKSMLVQTEGNLYDDPLDGSNRKQVNQNPAGGTLSAFRITPDRKRVAYVGDLQTKGSDNVFVRPLSRNEPQTKLSNNQTKTGQITSIRFAPDGDRILYEGALNNANREDLYIAPLDGNTPQTRLSNNTALGGSIESYRFTPDEERVIIKGDLTTAGFENLYAVPLDGDEAQTRLSNNTVADGIIHHYRFTPDGKRVVMEGDLMTDGVQNLYAAPVDGSQDQVQLSANTATDADLRALHITSNSNYAIWERKVGLGGTGDVYAAPLDQSGQANNLTHVAAVDGDVEDYSIVGNNRHVIFSYDTDQDLTADSLYLAYIDGSDGPTQLSDPLSGGDEIDSFTIGPNKRRVFYEVTPEFTDNADLFRAIIPLTKQESVSVGNTGSQQVEANGGAANTGGVSAGFNNVTKTGNLKTSYQSVSEDMLDEVVSQSAKQAVDFQLNTSAGAQVWNLDFDGSFNGGVDLTFNYDDTGMTLAEEKSLVIQHYTNGQWTAVDGVVNPATNTITADVDSFSPFALAVPEPNSLTLLGLGGLLAVWRRPKRALLSNA